VLAILPWRNSTNDVGAPVYRLFGIGGGLLTRLTIWSKKLR
jgi:hypothetical protein